MAIPREIKAETRQAGLVFASLKDMVRAALHGTNN